MPEPKSAPPVPGRKPVLTEAKQREYAIKNNKPARFEIKKPPTRIEKQSLGTQAGNHINEKFAELYNLDSLGQQAVQDHDRKITKYSQKHRIDPDI